MNKVLVVAIILLLAVSAFGADQSEEFRMANNFYEQKDYVSAVRLYESILSRGVESAPIYFNLGNAYFKQGDLGHAVVNYLRAKRLVPSDEDVLHNLEFAQRFSRVKMEGVELNPIEIFLSSIVGPYRLNTLSWVTTAISVLFFLLLTVRFGLGLNSVLLRSAIITSLTLLIATAGLTTFKYRSDYLTRTAVIVAEESTVRTGPSEQSEVELEGAPGLIVEILVESGDYYDVLFENKRRGWIKKELVVEI